MKDAEHADHLTAQMQRHANARSEWGALHAMQVALPVFAKVGNVKWLTIANDLSHQFVQKVGRQRIVARRIGRRPLSIAERAVFATERQPADGSPEHFSR